VVVGLKLYRYTPAVTVRVGLDIEVVLPDRDLQDVTMAELQAVVNHLVENGEAIWTGGSK